MICQNHLRERVGKNSTQSPPANAGGSDMRTVRERVGKNSTQSPPANAGGSDMRTWVSGWERIQPRVHPLTQVVLTCAPA
jgi:hypothetical protein